MSEIEHRPRARATTWLVAFVALSFCYAPADARGGKNRVRSLQHDTTTRTVGDAPPGTTTIRIRGSSTPTFSVYKLERPERVVIDLANASLDAASGQDDDATSWPVNSWSVSRVATHQVPGGARSTVRVVVHLARPSSYDVRARGTELVVVVTPHEAAPDDAALERLEKQLAESRARVERAQHEAEKARAEAAKAARATTGSAEEMAAARRLAEEREAKLRQAEERLEEERRQATERETKLRQAEERLEEERRQAAERETKLRQAAAREAKLRERAEQRALEMRGLAVREVEDKHKAELERAAARESELRAEAAREAEERAKAEKRAIAWEAEMRAQAARLAEERKQAEKRAAAREAELRAEAAHEAKARKQAEKRAAEERKRATREVALREAAEQSAQQSREAAARATAEAERARIEARARAREAEERIAKANQLMQSAETRLASAAKTEREARAAEREAERASRQVSEREREAADAEKRASAQLAEAERAHKAAREFLARAQNAKGDQAKARSLEERAQKAAREADERRARAERAAKDAEKERHQAENAAKAARERLRQSVAALEQASKAREEAEAARARAEQQRAVAEERREIAERARAQAEAAAREASERAARARELRLVEEKAYAEIVEARERARAGKRASEAASERLVHAQRAASEAEHKLASLRTDADEVARRLRDLAKKKTTSESQVEALEHQAEALAKDRARAERDVRARRADVDRLRDELGKLDKALAEKTKSLQAVEAAAIEAKTAREREETLLAQINERRAAAERALTEAQTERDRARAQAREYEKSLRAAEKRAKSARVAQARTPAKGKGGKAKSRSRKARSKAKAKSRSRSKARSKKSRAERSDGDGKQSQESAGKRPANTALVRVESLEFVDKERASRVEISLSGQAEPEVVAARGRRVVLELPGSELPERLQRTLDTSRFHGPIKSVSTYRDPRDASKVRVVVDLERPAKSTLQRSGTTYYWTFAKNRAEIAATAGGGQDAPTRTAARKPARPPATGAFGATSTPITQQSVAQLQRGKRKVYRGTKMDLDFKDADIHNLLRTLANVGGVNIVIPDEIQARVTVRLRRVPWDQALEVILASQGLWYKREGDLYRIATRKQLDAEAEAEAQRLAALVKAEPPEPQIFTLNYAVASKMKPQLSPLLSPKGRIEVDERTNSLIINDIQAHRRRIIDLLTRLDTQTPQVQIEARVVEARSDFSREIGIQWGGNLADSNAVGLYDLRGSNGGVLSPPYANTDPAVPTGYAVNIPASVEPGVGGAVQLALGSLSGGYQLALRLSALEETGTVRIISAPKITVLDNEEATISQGVSIPISVISANGVQTQFVEADLMLKVVPHVSQRDCSVQMELEVTKNEADFVNTGARGDPSILSKETKTSILLGDGETTVIGGIYTRNTGLAYSKIPLLGDLPVFGWLFKNRRETDNRTEVLIFITPKITNKAFLRCEN